MTSILTLQQRKQAFKILGRYLLSADSQLEQLIQSANFYNNWFTPQEVQRAVIANGRMLSDEDIDKWLEGVAQSTSEIPKKVGLILAGNIPMVGFHDIVTVLISGNIALIKLSSQDNKLLPFLLNKLVEIEPGFNERFEFVERLQGFDAVIATGSNNSSRYFEYYFSKVPHIIRKNRNSVAVLSGDENLKEFLALGDDIFNYYGLGCRNVSKLYVPAGYHFDNFFESIEVFKGVADNHKYNNNYDYNKSILLVNSYPHLDNGFLLLKQDQNFASPLAVLNYEEYTNFEELQLKLNKEAGNLQCVVSNIDLSIEAPRVAFGETQQPKLWDYADGVNTLEFLQRL